MGRRHPGNHSSPWRRRLCRADNDNNDSCRFFSMRKISGSRIQMIDLARPSAYAEKLNKAPLFICHTPGRRIHTLLMSKMKRSDDGHDDIYMKIDTRLYVEGVNLYRFACHASSRGCYAHDTCQMAATKSFPQSQSIKHFLIFISLLINRRVY